MSNVQRVRWSTNRSARRLKLWEYSVSNRGLRPGLIGTPAQVRERIAAYEAAGVDLLLLQMSPQYEEMERFAANVIRTAAAMLGAWCAPAVSGTAPTGPRVRQPSDMRLWRGP